MAFWSLLLSVFKKDNNLLSQASADICVEHTEFMRYIIDVEEVAEDVVKLFLRCKEVSYLGN